MFIDARELAEGAIINSDICIVGGGAAGITIAKELLNKSYKVCILESGGTEADPASQELGKGKSVGVPYFQVIDDKSFDRYLGGNTNRWASFCRPFDEIDFEKRDWVPHSGWPFTRKELEPYYERAQVVLKLKHPFNYETDYLSQQVTDPVFKPLPLEGEEIETKMWQFHFPILRFGEDYRANLETSSNTDVYLYANVIEIETNDAGKEITRLKVACLDGKQFWAQAKIFVLAMNGIETPRIMLASNKQQTAGIGNQNDLVGRFFMEHPHFHRSGLVLVPDLNAYPGLYTPEAKQFETMGALSPTRRFQEQEKILNYSATLDPTLRFWPNSNMTDGFISSLTAVVKDLRGLPERLLVKLGRKPRRQMNRAVLLDITTRSEQAPNPDSRVLLSRDLDPLGVPRYEVDWRLTALDKRTVLRTQQAIAEALGRSGLGRMKIEFSQDLDEDSAPWDPSQTEDCYFEGGWHHMGTTRMHDDPKQGVVDANCKVYGTENLFIAGSSLFPTGSYANPMLTLIALAIRLADHLDDEIRTI
ncbi:MAG: GMC family oxidoreductase [Synechococcales bacterium]|nr:GMC family oxidoreductase [Synechococcales bacterium]